MYRQRLGNKFGAQRSTFMDVQYDSKFEASVAQELELRKKAHDILDWDRQFKVEMWAHRPDGTPAFKVTHKVDFRIHHKDGSFELLEAKGVETADYKMRRKFLETIWLPEHLDHTYTVVKQAKYYKPKQW
jgi:polysaccharide pyruvyl transferase WcaK-like protein